MFTAGFLSLRDLFAVLKKNCLCPVFAGREFIPTQAPYPYICRRKNSGF
jgi:hypothetical protein